MCVRSLQMALILSTLTVSPQSYLPLVVLALHHTAETQNVSESSQVKWNAYLVRQSRKRKLSRKVNALNSFHGEHHWTGQALPPSHEVIWQTRRRFSQSDRLQYVMQLLRIKNSYNQHLKESQCEMLVINKLCSCNQSTQRSSMLMTASFKWRDVGSSE